MIASHVPLAEKVLPHEELAALWNAGEWELTVEDGGEPGREAGLIQPLTLVQKPSPVKHSCLDTLLLRLTRHFSWSYPCIQRLIATLPFFGQIMW